MLRRIFKAEVAISLMENRLVWQLDKPYHKMLQCLRPGVPSSIPGLGDTVFANPLVILDPYVNNRGPPIELPSLCGMRTDAESLRRTHSGKRSVEETIGQFLHTPDTGQDAKEKRP